MSSDIVERLRAESFGADGKSYPHYINPDGPEAADEIERLRAEVAKFAAAEGRE